MKSFITYGCMLLLLFSTSLVAQNQLLETQGKSRNEYYFRLSFNGPKQLFDIGKLVSIDKIEQNSCIAYANNKQYEALKSEGYMPELLVPPSLQIPDLKMFDATDDKSTYEWDAYPTYSAYVNMMNAFQTDYPNLCTIHTIHTLTSGHQLLVAQINNGDPEGKAQFLYTSSIHGDELTAYVLTLRLIDYLLSNYGTDEEVTEMVDHMDIWINPLANPDGTYHQNDNTVNGATRGNANGIDMNRNYADPQDGQHPDGNMWQAETVAFMNLADEQHFTMSANFHGGAEVMNYPWDTWYRRHADDNWWIFVSREYADTVHSYAPNGYFTDLENGITNGYDWYTISGGRQDYMNYFHQCREITIEISAVKTPPAVQLPLFWNYNYRSMLNYLHEGMYGLRGTVTDSITGEPLRARLEIIGHDLDSSHVYSVLPSGVYHRPIKNGAYDLTFSAPGYYSKTLPDVQLDDYETLVNDVQLVPGVVIASLEASATEINKNTSIDFFDRSFGQNIISWEWQFEGANPSTSNVQNPVGISYPETGDFNVQLTVINEDGLSDVVLIEEYIHVSLNYLIGNTTITTCEGNFYDNGGPTGNYTDDGDFTSVVMPSLPEYFSQVQFTEFDVEAEASCDYDYLRIYDGTSSSAPLIGEYCGTNSPGLVTATNETGALTFVFHSDNSVNGSGWKAAFACIPMVGLGEPTYFDVMVYPNPVSRDHVSVLSDTSMESLQLSDFRGRILFVSNLAGEKQFDLDVNNYASGVYFLKVQRATGMVVRKIIVK